MQTEDTPPRARRPAGGAAFFTGLRAVIFALVVIGILFVAFDAVERSVLGDVSMTRLHALHEIRAVLAALVAASVASWLVLRAPPLFPDAESPRAAAAAATSTEERQRRFAEWFIQMRWIAVIVAIVLVLVTSEVLGYLARPLLWPLLAVVGALALLNAGYAAAAGAGVATRALLMTQAYGDLVILTALLHFSGGVENPLGSLMLFHVLIAGIVLSRRQCYLVAGGASLLFAGMAWAELSGTVPHYTLTLFPHAVEGGHHLHAALETPFVISRVGLQFVVLFLTGYFTSTVTTQLQHRERQLEEMADEAREQSQLLERALDSTGTGLCVRGANLAPRWANPRWGEFFGDAAGGPDAAGELRARRTLKDGSVNVGEVVVAPAGGDAVAGAAGARTILLTTAPLAGKGGAVTHVVELARDVSELRLIQERIGSAERLAAVGELAGKVAHEVNNPIAVISAKTRLLLSRNRDELSDRTAAELTKITELADKVAHIARGLLSYSRPSHGAAAPTDIRAPLGRALSMIEPAAEATGIRILQDLPPSLPAVYGNAAEIEQVFVNLFMNAVDAMPRGGRLSIRVAVDDPTDDVVGRPGTASGDDAPRAAPSTLTITVEDTGTGIARELQAQVFEPFVTTKPEGRGTGLGLAICRGLVRTHGGRIALESEPGRGTRVFVTLPFHHSVTVEASAHA